MSERLPPLTALRAFEVAARHMSFALAANELHVTPAALSYQIKSLEDHLGAPVFRRLNRAVELTEVGKSLSLQVSEGFRQIEAGWSTARRLIDTNTLTVTAGPALTAKWLAPRLAEFARAHPEIDLRISATLRQLDLHRDDVDVALRFGYGPDTGLYSLPARREWLTPAMSPELAERFTTLESLQEAPLIHDESISFLRPKCDWATWFRAVGLSFDNAHGARFSNADHAVDAAVAGVGVVLGRRPMLIKDIQDGRLVAPFKTAIETKARFRFLCLTGAEARPQVAAFRDWFATEINRTAFFSDEFNVIPVEDLQ